MTVSIDLPYGADTGQSVAKPMNDPSYDELRYWHHEGARLTGDYCSSCDSDFSSDSDTKKSKNKAKKGQNKNKSSANSDESGATAKQAEEKEHSPASTPSPPHPILKRNVLQDMTDHICCRACNAGLHCLQHTYLDGKIVITGNRLLG
jgi:hypothetical protein